MVVEQNQLESFLTHYETENSIERFVKVTCVKALPAGENYMSVIWRVTFHIILKSGRRTKRHLIVKEAIMGGHHGLFLKAHGIFELEIEVYENILKPMQDIMEIHGDTRDTQWAELIASHPNTLILQDLSTRGYKTVDRRKMLDLDHTVLLVTELGRFHAMGLAVFEKDFADKKYFNLSLIFSDAHFFKNIFKGALKIFTLALETAWGSEWQEAAKRMKTFTETAYEKFVKLLEIDVERLNVLNHGDCWSNNTMFKYSDLNRPVGVKFVDFQMIHYNSFAVDLTYLLYNSTHPDVRRANFNEIIEAYRDSLAYNFEFYGVDRKLPSLDDMIKEMNRLRPFACLILCSFHPLMIGEGKPMDMEKIVDKDTQHSDSLNLEAYTSEYFKRNISKDIIAFMKDGII